MTQADLFYRAFAALKKELKGDKSLTALIKAVTEAQEPESIVVVHNVCRVDPDWVEAIERGLIFIDRAIAEDRQFIRSEGEIQPIEKVRHISRESVQHLARHSDLITREQTSEDIVPDKLYTVERLSDAAVYENKFLYLLLTKIRDFVSYRYDAILRAYNLYRGELTVKKEVKTTHRTLSYEIKLTDEQDRSVAAADPECAAYLSRMEKIQSSVAFFLKTPLMTEVARADKIKSKITKTNVLRMDKNFKEAVTLYEYLLAYGKEGFTVERQEAKRDPVEGDAAKDLAISALLDAFLVYEHGLGLEAYLKEEYEKEEALRAEKAQLALVEKIKQLKARVEATGEGVEKYMALLEERNAYLERDSKLLVEARAEIETLKAEAERLRGQISVLEEEIAALNEANELLKEEQKRMEEEHRAKLRKLQEEQQREIAALEQKHREAIVALRYENEKALMMAKHAAEEELTQTVATLEGKRRDEIARISAQYDAKLDEERKKTIDLERAARTLRSSYSAASAEAKNIARECEILRARITALRSEKGLFTPADDFTTEEGFNALEHEFEVLGRLVRDSWTDVKKILKQEFYAGVRATMRKKKPVKTDLYKEIAAETEARNAAEGKKAAETAETQAEGQAVGAQETADREGIDEETDDD